MLYFSSLISQILEDSKGPMLFCKFLAFNSSKRDKVIEICIGEKLRVVINNVNWNFYFLRGSRWRFSKVFKIDGDS